MINNNDNNNNNNNNNNNYNNKLNRRIFVPLSPGEDGDGSGMCCEREITT